MSSFLMYLTMSSTFLEESKSKHRSKHFFLMSFEGEESEDDPEDHLEPQFRLAIGSPYQKEVDMILERLKANIDKPSN